MTATTLSGSRATEPPRPTAKKMSQSKPVTISKDTPVHMGLVVLLISAVIGGATMIFELRWSVMGEIGAVSTEMRDLQEEVRTLNRSVEDNSDAIEELGPNFVSRGELRTWIRLARVKNEGSGVEFPDLEQ